MVERLDRDKVIVGDSRRLQQLSKNPLFKSDVAMVKESGESDFIEIEMKPRKVIDDKPLAMGVAILQHSKLLFLRFVYEVLWEFCEPGSLKLNYCDTDSLAICKFIFLPFVINYNSNSHNEDWDL